MNYKIKIDREIATLMDMFDSIHAQNMCKRKLIGEEKTATPKSIRPKHLILKTL